MSAAMFAKVKELNLRVDKLEAELSEMRQKSGEIPAPHVANGTKPAPLGLKKPA